MKKKDRGHVVDFELEGIFAGLAAGALLLGCEILLAQGIGHRPLAPLIYAASIIMVERAFTAPVVWVVLLGAAIHASLSALCGFVYGVVATEERTGTRQNWRRQVLFGASAGVAVWALGFLVVAPTFYPWIAQAAPLWQLLLHVVAFGIPMGLVFAYLDERRAGSTKTLHHQP